MVAGPEYYTRLRSESSSQRSNARSWRTLTACTRRRLAGSSLARGKGGAHSATKPKILLAILGKMALKPEVKFDKLYPKLYNVELWLLAYQQLAPKPGNMTPGTDGQTMTGQG